MNYFWDGFEKRAIDAKRYAKALQNTLDREVAGLSKRPPAYDRVAQGFQRSAEVAKKFVNTDSKKALKAMRNTLNRTKASTATAKQMLADG